MQLPKNMVNVSTWMEGCGDFGSSSHIQSKPIKFLYSKLQSNFIKLSLEDDIFIWFKTTANGYDTTNLGYSTSFLESEQEEDWCWCMPPLWKLKATMKSKLFF